MIYPFVTLPMMALLAGLWLLFSHGFALARPGLVGDWLKAFPRSRGAGIALLAIVTIWAFLLIFNMDLGEFSNFRKPLLILIPIAAVLAAKFVDEFLAVRALGMLLLLIAEPLLEAAFLKPPVSRLLLVIVAYLGAVIGMFYVGMPYLMRDHVAWLRRSDVRWKVAAWSGLIAGVALLICSATRYRSA